MKPFPILSILIPLFYASITTAAIGQSAVITLVFPYGARSASMGEVGTALADDGSVMFFNPAGLDLPNEKYEGGAFSFSREQLLPEFQMRDLLHSAMSANFQVPGLGCGQFGISRNFINMGVSTYTDEMGRETGSAHSSETVTALSWGVDLGKVGIKNQFIGLSAKFYSSALAPNINGPGTGIGRGIAFDAGYIWTMGKGFRLGATFMNMGPSVYYIDPHKADPIPFTINLALAYKKAFDIEGNKLMSFAGEVRFDREVVKNYADGKPDPFYRAIWTDLLHDTSETPKFEWLQVNRHYGGEVTFLNTFSIRMGYLIDFVGSRYEQHHGFGITLFNHIAIDRSEIYSPAGYMREFSRRYESSGDGASGARHKQWQYSVTLFRLLKWEPEDVAWWESK